jgi:hypothetical protein
VCFCIGLVEERATSLPSMLLLGSFPMALPARLVPGWIKTWQAMFAQSC